MAIYYKEMEEIAKLYSLMTDKDCKYWSRNAAQMMFEDELLYCSEHGIQCPLTNVDVLYETIGLMIDQDER